mgnify:CR=1 FL=1
MKALGVENGRYPQSGRVRFHQSYICSFVVGTKFQHIALSIEVRPDSRACIIPDRVQAPLPRFKLPLPAIIIS